MWCVMAAPGQAEGMWACVRVLPMSSILFFFHVLFTIWSLRNTWFLPRSRRRQSALCTRLLFYAVEGQRSDPRDWQREVTSYDKLSSQQETEEKGGTCGWKEWGGDIRGNGGEAEEVVESDVRRRIEGEAEQMRGWGDSQGEKKGRKVQRCLAVVVCESVPSYGVQSDTELLRC